MSNKVFDQGYQMGLAAGIVQAAAPTRTIETRYFKAEHDVHAGMALLEVLGAYLESNCSSSEDLTLETFNCVAHQYHAALERLRPAVKKLYG